MVYSQTMEDWESAFHQWVEGEEMEASAIENAYNVLSEIADNPINLNQTTKEELEQLPFLTSQQIEEILAYVNRYGVMRSTGELQMLTTFDTEQRHLLQHFVYIGQPKIKKDKFRLDSVLRHSKHQLMMTGKIPLYERKGDKNGYLGPKYQHSLRYQMKYHEKWKLGLTAAQDAGEPFFKNKNSWGYDHYSYYLQIKNLGVIDNLCLGMYRVQLGMGLIMNGGFYLGKLATLQSMGRSAATLRPHSSRSSQGFLQGAAATVHLTKNWTMTAFASYRSLDATLNDDGSARTLLTSSYHRTPSEINKKNNTHETDLGGSIGFRKGTLFVNANLLYTKFSRSLSPQKTNTPYRRYAAEGNNFFNTSIDYGYNNARLSFSGEIALNKAGALAVINKLSYRMNACLDIMALHRLYDKKYTAHHARSFSENAAIQNEHGIYVGVNWQPSQKLAIKWYADYAHFPYLRYQVSMPSDAFDTMILLRTLLNKTWSIEGRYRLHIRQKDNENKTFLLNQTEHRARLRLTGNWPIGLTSQTQAEAISVNYKEKSKGWILSQLFSYNWRMLKFAGCFSYYHTDNYASRLYLYEQPMLYEYTSLMLYGHGIRYSFKAHANIGNHLILSAKIGVTNYFDRSSISSSLQEVFASSMTDLFIQLQYKF